MRNTRQMQIALEDVGKLAPTAGKRPRDAHGRFVQLLGSAPYDASKVVHGHDWRSDRDAAEMKTYGCD